MHTHDNDYCVILAGGQGHRLWPASRQKLPKQFLDLCGTGRTLLQQTYDRFLSIVPEDHIYVCTYESYADAVCSQLPRLPREHVLAEPVQLSTAPTAAWATFLIEKADPGAGIILTPSDHIIADEDGFAEQIGRGLAFARGQEQIVAIGHRPTRPDTLYGYIQKDAPADAAGFYGVKSFSEKPGEAYARMFVESGEFLWNTGLFIWSAPAMVRQLEQLMPQMAAHWRSEGKEDARPPMERLYPASLRLSADLMILEHIPGVCVQECSFGWVDIGTWEAVAQTTSGTDVDGNALLPGVRSLLEGCRDNVISAPAGTLVCIEGLSGYAVSVTDGVVMICPKDHQETMRKFRTQAGVIDSEAYT